MRSGSVWMTVLTTVVGSESCSESSSGLTTVALGSGSVQVMMSATVQGAESGSGLVTVSVVVLAPGSGSESGLESERRWTWGRTPCG